ncbi:hypothetical protein GGH94_006088 [Coemansia aciculifera]|uniref:molybdopterin adenylyltransferase n=1 Tax=Coemansia aciculifera TaxID=417176 RepID=A0A9W8M0N7_9FUNG|nr:hypothetical protein GGH94_006088 [Coemansia aciculifera]
MATSVGILTVSDKCSRGQALDTSGPALRQLLETASSGGQRWTVVASLVVPDDRTLISQTIRDWCVLPATSVPLCRLVVVTGGTGISPSDVTVEAIEPLFTKKLPSLATAMVVGSLKITPMAALSQVTAGVVGETIVVAVPGSKKGSVENLQQILSVLPHAVDTAMAQSGTRHLHSSSGVPIPSTVEAQPLAMCGCSRPDDDTTTHVAEGLSNDLEASVDRRARKSPYPMIPVDEALRLVLSHIAELPAVELPLRDIREGQIIAADVIARENVPGYPAAVMDGYAVIAADGPGTFTVRGATTAGRATMASEEKLLQTGEVMRVATGAPIPLGANAVVMVEDTQLLESHNGEESVVRILESGRVVPGQHIRAVGHDLRKGSVVVSAGSAITAVGGEIGALAVSGHNKFLVHAMPRIAVLSSGDEVVDTLKPTSTLEYGAIRDCNRPALLAALASLGCPTFDLGVVKDDPDSLAQTMGQALTTCQGIISTGGVSMGERDWLKPVVEQRLNGKIIFGRVAMKPSKPTTFAAMPTGKFVFALPGNPVSALVAFHMFAAPAIRKLAGHLVKQRGEMAMSILRPSVLAVFEGSDIHLDRVRPEYLRAALAWDQKKFQWSVRVTDQHQQSSRVASMLHANALISLPRGTNEKPTVRSGESVTAIIIASPHFQ